MANNGGGQRGGNANNMNEHVEFTVKAEEDLYLTGSETTIRRVTAETNYSCLMLKTQRFSSLFRHYAKYHGLRKDDLEYYFVNPLENEDTPETVQLQRGDTIMVRKRRKPVQPTPETNDNEFIKDFREILDDEEHMDAVFLVYPDGTHDLNLKDDEKTQIRVHKCILAARAEYFKALFRKGVSGDYSTVGITFRESRECIIRVEQQFSEAHIRATIEFLYTNRVENMRDFQTDDLLCLLNLSDKWLLNDLKRLVEHQLIRHHMEVSTVARMYCASQDFHASRLSHACINFIMTNIRQVTANATFQEEMKNYPHLCIPVLKAAAELIPEGPLPKKQRTEAITSETPSAAVNMSSSVPDSDP
mmetsp:Transcript_39186/g.55142  ORF Transcript_39186/g.55142 Transcript_39186/m.55142 type:complete len:360 (-) Transcript_39186:631-1710(-)|eukprot:CAMPEP_0202478312 /NCGR_PEP_ID=MMETSP1360-20130828/94395_1 /ASSEMBLY_ACC=CAM_ASM_000848 /TAXON_ID=515479 /ORGANISM="Licmophora paradoxa, Strain CCMP2313" /LENGTH=359 /DNA_ID=CAMNT_0049105589 /DNA_START=55 /DNA_END=1134 /DNA_ORIENTATION=+